MSKLTQIFLLPLSWLYGITVSFRNLCYDVHLFHCERLSVPVISVGNITVGGTGKTPFVEYLLEYILGQSKKVALLSRGYKRSTKGMQVVSDGSKLFADALAIGDEPYQIAKKFPRAVVIVDKKRLHGAKYAIEKFGAEVILLDDGFQHRSLARDLDIVLVDSRQSLNKARLLPAGLKREPMRSLCRANIVAYTHFSNTQLENLDLYTSAEVIKIDFMPVRLSKLDGSNGLELKSFQGKSCAAFCGIAKSEYFYETLKNIGLNILCFHEFGDHYNYSKLDLERIQKDFIKHKANFIISTEKDAVRLLAMNIETSFIDSFYYLEIKTEICEGEKSLLRLIDQTINNNPS
jgi:tetraacyldisaccharide 4'-kinase